MIQVLFTVDVEIWCETWSDIDREFAEAFGRYIYGPTASGDYGLPFTLQTLRDYGLRGVFFVEPLFAARFGVGPLSEIVELIQDAGQEVQLHLHTEWVDEAREPLLPAVSAKKQFLWMFSRAEQVALIEAGRRLLCQAGARTPSAFRAGNYGLGSETWAALNDAGIHLDSSLNPSMIHPASGVAAEPVCTQPFLRNGVVEVPVSVYRDGFGRLRNAQVAACSFAELEKLLLRAAAGKWNSVVIVSHSFELLNAAKNKPDRIAVERFAKLCRFLDRHRDVFQTQGFFDPAPPPRSEQPPPPALPTHLAGLRLAEQVLRRLSV
jgi:hypothetical protein